MCFATFYKERFLAIFYKERFLALFFRRDTVRPRLHFTSECFRLYFTRETL